MLKPWDTVIDIGANVGYYTLLSVISVGVGGHVHAVEAHPGAYGFLEKNVKLYLLSQVTTYCTGLGGAVGEVKFSDRDRDDLNQISEAGTVTVPVGLLGGLGVEAEKIKLLKVDARLMKSLFWPVG